MTQDSRIQQLRNWLLGLDAEPCELVPVSGDASFRRYFRVKFADNSLIAVDAPPEKEDSRPFVAIANAWLQQGIPVPEIRAVDFEQGFMLLADFGDDLLLAHLHKDTADSWYRRAFNLLHNIQAVTGVEDYDLPLYDTQRLTDEMQLFIDWCLQARLRLTLTEDEQRLLRQTFSQLVVNASEQPQVCVHRDYHSRNLMCVGDDRLGVIDFQDAVWGPVTYDLVSLLKDCYICWPRSQVLIWAEAFRKQWQLLNPQQPVDTATWVRWFDWMGLQRHIKVVGIFCRLALRDGKSGYLADIPRTFNYLYEVTRIYPELTEFSSWLERRVIPAMQAEGLLP